MRNYPYLFGFLERVPSLKLTIRPNNRPIAMLHSLHLQHHEEQVKPSKQVDCPLGFSHGYTPLISLVHSEFRMISLLPYRQFFTPPRF